MIMCSINTSVAVSDFLEHEAELQDSPYLIHRLLLFLVWLCVFVHILCVYTCLYSYCVFQVTTALQSIQDGP